MRELAQLGWSDPVVPIGSRLETVEVTDEAGRAVAFRVVHGAALTPAGVPPLAARLLPGAGETVPVVVSRYLSPRLQQVLASAGLSYADLVGNVRFVSRDPAISIRTVGGKSDPWRGPGRRRETLRGAPAARVVRALCDLRPPFSVPELMQASGASAGATYRVIDFVVEQGYVERDPSGRVSRVDWRPLLERWAADEPQLSAERSYPFLAPRGDLDAVLAMFAGPSLPRSCVTGSFALRGLTSVAPARLLVAYTDEPLLVAERLSLVPVEAGANVVLARPFDASVFQRDRVFGAVRFVAASQLAADLLSSPGRGPNEGEALLEWMEAHEDAWRF